MEDAGRAPTGASWHTRVFFGLHYDLHAEAGDTVLGRDLTSEHLRTELEKVRPDWVQCDCKGHPGYASYPTAVGIASPGIVKDALRIHRDVTREMGIPLVVHFSGVWDDAAMAAHPEWRRVGPEDVGSSGAVGPAQPGRACLSGPYRGEYMIPQMLEIVERYDVDGFWVDGENWASEPCYCARCRGLFAAAHAGAAAPLAPGQPLWAAWLGFHRRLFEEHVRGYTEAVHARKRSCLVCSNWMYAMRQPDPVAVPVDYLSGDFVPSGGVEQAAAEARLLDGRGLPWNLMAWTFLTGEKEWDGWTTKPLPQLCQEAAEVLSCGGALSLYDQPQRSGHLVGWHQDLFAQVASFCRARQEVAQDSVSVPQVAVLHGAASYYARNQPLYKPGQATDGVEGALHALLDAGYHADLLTEDMLLRRMAEYPLVVLAEQDPLSPAIAAALAGYVAAGGSLLLGGSHVATTLGELAGVAPAGEPLSGYRYLPAGRGVVTAAGPWQPVSLAGATALMPLLSDQEPARDVLTTPAITVRSAGQGRVVAIHGPAFSAYYRTRYPGLRDVLASAVGAAWATPMVQVKAPGPVALTLRGQPGRLIVHLLNRGAAPPTGPHRAIVEQVPSLGPVTVRLHCTEPRKVWAVPDTAQMTSTWSAGTLTIHVSKLEIHVAVVADGAGEQGVPAG